VYWLSSLFAELYLSCFYPHKQVLQQGPLRAVDFFSLYWSLAYRASDAHLPSANSSDIAGADKALRRHYDELVAFVQNREVKQQDFRYARL
jgi:hypothetical protein